MKVLGPEVMAESNSVTNLEVAGGNELLDGIDRSEALVDQCRDLLEMTVERSYAEGNEEWFDINPGKVGGGVRRGVDERLCEICSARAEGWGRAGPLAFRHGTSVADRGQIAR